MNSFQDPASRITPITVLVADKFEIVRYGIAHEIDLQSDIELVGEATNAHDLVQLTTQLRPDIVILDIHFADRKGLHVIRELACLNLPSEGSRLYSPQILVLSSYRDRQYVIGSLVAGARGYLLKSEDPAQVIQGIRQLADGQTALSLSIQTLLVDVISSINAKLSPSEKSVLKLLAHGYTNKHIATELSIAERTVQSHLNNTYRKLIPVRNRAEAVAWVWINELE